MPELKRPLEDSDSTALVAVKKPRNELVEAQPKGGAVVQSVRLHLLCLMLDKPVKCRILISGTAQDLKYGGAHHAFDRP